MCRVRPGVAAAPYASPVHIMSSIVTGPYRSNVPLDEQGRCLRRLSSRPALPGAGLRPDGGTCCARHATRRPGGPGAAGFVATFGSALRGERNITTRAQLSPDLRGGKGSVREDGIHEARPPLA